MARLMRIFKILDYDFIRKVYLSEANDENTVSLKVELSPDDVDLLKTHEISEIVIKVKVKPSADNERVSCKADVILRQCHKRRSR